MNCEDFRLDLGDFLDGELGDESRRMNLLRHLESCSLCRQYRRELEDLKQSVHASGFVQPPEMVWENIHSRIALEPGLDIFRIFTQPSFAMAIAVAIFAFVITAQMIRHQGPVGSVAASPKLLDEEFGTVYGFDTDMEKGLM